MYQQKDSKVNAWKKSSSVGNAHFSTSLYEFCILNKSEFWLTQLHKRLSKKAIDTKTCFSEATSRVFESVVVSGDTHT